MNRCSWILLFQFFLVQLAYPCSSFVLKDGNSIFLGKNFDWTLDKGVVIKNLAGTTKSAYYSHQGNPATWISRYGSVTFNQNGKEMPYGGMNEKGLVVEMLWLEETRYNIADNKSYLNELEWIQYQLDNFQSIDEVVDHLESLKIYPIKGKIHYILADANGHSSIIEYMDGKPTVFQRDSNTCQAITNKSVPYSSRYAENIDDIPRQNSSDIYRYYQLERQIKSFQKSKENGDALAFGLLEKVRIQKGNFKTVWTIVYDISNRSIAFYTHKSKKTKRISLNNLDFKNQLSFLDINQNRITELDQQLQPLTEQKNLEFVSASLTHLGFEENLSQEISKQQFNPDSSKTSLYSENYFHFDISIPLSETGKRLFFVIMDSEENFNRKQPVGGSYIFGTTMVGIIHRHIYGLKNGRYSMLALIDENRNLELDFDAEGNATEQYAIFGEFIPKSMADLKFSNTAGEFSRDNAKILIVWR